MIDYQKQFIQYSLQNGVLRFGSFQLKSGRNSPYFFNTGLFNTGAQLFELGRYYAHRLSDAEIDVDVLYGPAYKGIPLVCATAIAYSQISGKDMPFAFNRKESKDHGEGGAVVGSDLTGNVLILDDVITAGTSVRESVEIIKANGANPYGVLIALDRQEKGEHQYSAIKEVEQKFGIPVFAIISIGDIIEYLQQIDSDSPELKSIRAYHQTYGIHIEKQ